MEQRSHHLEKRAFKFANDCRDLAKTLTTTVSNAEDCKQLIRSSEAIVANYIEANKKVGDKDFLLRCKTAHVEAKECGYWLRMLEPFNQEQSVEIETLIIESEELKGMLSAIINKVE
ncbi:four helix bundle protein [Gelidibacter salicanalis]|uniref:Four helix bundle protein n=1 Tax=Gelidibacter salicanalis TaxID=291193 RepID=A0A934KKY7_9FLAO|nr:four helix bundle protein [Gelidibacter salicanalis]MBJ7881032.1 four helix bundle protein [Gelidibacter salicanalis]